MDRAFRKGKAAGLSPAREAAGGRYPQRDGEPNIVKVAGGWDRPAKNGPFKLFFIN